MCRLLYFFGFGWLSWLRAISQKHGGSEIEDCTVFCWLDFRGSGGARHKCLQDQSETTDPPPKHLTMLSNAGPTWRPGRWCSRSSWCVQPWESRWWWYPATWTSWIHGSFLTTKPEPLAAAAFDAEQFCMLMFFLISGCCKNWAMLQQKCVDLVGISTLQGKCLHELSSNSRNIWPTWMRHPGSGGIGWEFPQHLGISRVMLYQETAV